MEHANRVLRSSFDAREDVPHDIQEDQSGEAEGGVASSRGKVLERVDNDLVGCGASAEGVKCQQP